MILPSGPKKDIKSTKIYDSNTQSVDYIIGLVPREKPEQLAERGTQNNRPEYFTSVTRKMAYNTQIKLLVMNLH